MTSKPRASSRPTLLPLLAGALDLFSDPLGEFMEGWREQGEVVRLAVPHRPAYLVVHPDHVRHVLYERRELYRRDRWHTTQLRRVSGNGLTASEGELWREQRGIMRRELLSGRVRAMTPRAVEATDRMLARWRTIAAAGGTVELRGEMLRVSLEAIFCCLFTTDIESESPAILDSAAVVLDHLYARMRLGLPLLARTLAPERRRFRTAREALYARAERLLVDGRCRRGAPGKAGDTHEAEDMLGLLAAQADRGLARDQIVTMLLAGHDTTGAALAWACHRAAVDPQLALNLREDESPQLGTAPGAATSFAGQLFAETLRLFPPAWALSRTPDSEDTIGGCTIPAGATVFVSPFVTHRHPDFWRAPTRFDPRRFDTSGGEHAAANGHAYAYLPFGAGPRMCVGKVLAEMIGEVVLSSVYRSFRLVPADSGAPATKAALTLRPDRPLRVYPRPLGD